MMDDVYGLIKKHWPLYSQFSTSTMDGIHVAITEVRNWHPKCETCGHRAVDSAGIPETSESGKTFICVIVMGGVQHDHYCAEHTALWGEEE